MAVRNGGRQSSSQSSQWRAGTLTSPWHFVGGGIAIAVLFVVLGMVALPRLRGIAMAHIAEQSAA
jgi:hypothetical protein